MQAGRQDEEMALDDNDDDDDDDEPPLLVALDNDHDTIPNHGSPTKLVETPSSSLPARTLAPPCPVTILSGFLGSGKTTLIQYILQSPHHGKRIAVIENEFGQGLDVESMIARDGANNQSLQDLIELPNGCVCCTVKDSLVTTLEALVEKRADLDYILIECSGMANPGPIASIFWLDDALDSRLRLDGIVTLCDAAHIREQLETTEEAGQQIAYADRILLNKMDLVQDKTDNINKPTTETAESLTTLIRQYHPVAPIRQTTFSSVPDLDWILDARCFDSDRFQLVEESVAKLQQSATEATTVDAPAHDHAHNHSHNHNHDDDCALCHQSNAVTTTTTHKHTSGITSFALVEAGTLDLQKLNRWLASALWPNQDATNQTLTALIHSDDPQTSTMAHQRSTTQSNEQKIFRIKGVVSVRQYEASDTYDEQYAVLPDLVDKRRFILQSVHDLWDLYPASNALQWKENEERTNKVVVIGKNLDEAVLRQGFRACLAT